MKRYIVASVLRWKLPQEISEVFKSMTPLSISLSPILLVIIFTLPPAHALEALDDQEMGAVTGQEGVMVSMEYYYNSMRTDNPATTGAGLSKCTDGGLGDMDCRLAWQLSNRGNAGSAGIYNPTNWTLPGGGGCNGSPTCKGEWLVWKAGWASLSVNNLMLDAATLGDAESSANAGDPDTGYEAWLAPNLEPIYGSFVDSEGACLMPVGPSDGGGACTAAYMRAMPALKTHYPNTGGTYDSNTRTAAGFNDVRFGLEVTGLSAEYDSATQPGWMLNNGGSFTSLKIADNAGHQAGIAFGGDFYLYGF
ncbi:hypothetical protein [Alcanivorax jadensis]|uniref:hypothetical protein n=1 Tax=Alcanivorax jadensis TaxID=64988 RepID=UPI0024091469|nr:hypothetical protein [Alcanivorax jadensis]MDF1637847.1 hypothetical protein [Alcanivorax jadensis]